MHLICIEKKTNKKQNKKQQRGCTLATFYNNSAVCILILVNAFFIIIYFYFNISFCAQRCLELKNLNAVFEIAQGLADPNVQKQTKLWVRAQNTTE